jgi:hypothetical protein
MMRRRRRWATPNQPTAQAKQIWRYVYSEPWPKGWRVEWVKCFDHRHSQRIGQCAYGRKLISLHYRAHAEPDYSEHHENRFLYVGGPGLPQRAVLYAHGGHCTYAETGPEILAYTVKRIPHQRSVIDTLIHEFTHLRNRGLKHGKEFERLVSWGMNKLGLPRHYV